MPSIAMGCVCVCVVCDYGCVLLAMHCHTSKQVREYKRSYLERDDWSGVMLKGTETHTLIPLTSFFFPLSIFNYHPVSLHAVFFHSFTPTHWGYSSLTLSTEYNAAIPSFVMLMLCIFSFLGTAMYAVF